MAEKVMCNYDCEQCGKTYQDELYPDDPSDCCYCPECRKEAAEIEATETVISMAKSCLPNTLFLQFTGLLRLVFDKKEYVKLPDM